MQNGSNDNYYSLRAAPGAGKNFLATLLNKHHNSDPFLFHYSKNYNEYFNTSEMVVDSFGEYTIPFWDNKWKFVNSRLRNQNDISSKVVHEHEWISTKLNGSEYVRRFKIFDRTNGDIGIDPNTFIKSTIIGYYITTKTAEEYNFITKLIFVKKYLGDRPNIIFDKINSNFSSNDLHSIKYLSPLGNVEYNSNFNINAWIEFVKFLNKEVPNSYAFSEINYRYFNEYINFKFKLNLDSYLIFYEQFKSDWIDRWKNTELQFIKDEMKNLENFKLQNPNIIEVPYKDLFLDQIETGTVFDMFKDEISEYTKRNIQLIESVENFFGDILS